MMKRRSGPKSRTSIYLGVTQYKRTGRWEAHIWESSDSRQSKGRQLHLGSFPAAQPAALAYDRAAYKLRPYTTHFNFPDTDYTQDEFIKRFGGLDKHEFVQRLRTWAQSPDLAQEYDQPIPLAAANSLKVDRHPFLPITLSPRPPMSKRARKKRSAVTYSQERPHYPPFSPAKNQYGAMHSCQEGQEGMKSPQQHKGIPQHILELHAIALGKQAVVKAEPAPAPLLDHCQQLRDFLHASPMPTAVPQPPQAMNCIFG